MLLSGNQVKVSVVSEKLQEMLFFGALCLSTLSVYAVAECTGGCQEPTLLYQDLNCKPKFASPGDCCPSEFDCSHIDAKASAREEKCQFHGKAYDIGEKIDNDKTYGNCQVGCRCRKKSSGTIGFTCAILDCPEWLGAQPLPGCHLKYELGKCCSVGSICPPFSAECEINGKTYQEGERFTYPNEKCSECVCREGWEGKFEAPFCKKNGCIEEVSQQKEVYSFCAPSYITKGDCCPFNWICPEDDDKIVSKPTPGNADLKCKFGHKTLNIGDKFERTSGEKGRLACECRIPPYLTCIQNYEYPTYAPEY